MNTDIRLKVGFFDHPKTIKLQRKLGIEAIVCLQRLWMFCAAYKPSGCLEGMDEEEIAIAAHWPNESLTFVTTLVDIRYLEQKDGVYRLHDWEDHNGYASSATDRSDKSRFSRMAKTHPRIYADLKGKGVDAISAEDYKRLTTVQRPFNESLTNRTSPFPLPSPSPLPEQKPKDIVSPFHFHIEDLAAKYPQVDIERVKIDLLIWMDKHPERRESDIKIKQKIVDIMEHEQSRAEKKEAVGECFEILWAKYPEKDGNKKDVKAKIEKQLATEQDISDIKLAFDNYMKFIELKRADGFADLKYRNRKTWFNNWRDWVEWEEPKTEKAGAKSQLVGGYVVK